MGLEYKQEEKNQKKKGGGKMEKQTIALIAVAILLVIAVGYIGIGKYQQNKVQQQIIVYQQGIQAGYQQAIVQLIQQAATCQAVPVTFQNQTINMIAVECLTTR